MGHINTKNMTEADWLQERKKGIGGSDITTIFGLNPFKTPYELWLEKTNRKEPENLKGNDAVEMGNLLEPIIAERYCQKTGNQIQNDNKLYFKDNKPFLRGNIDRRVIKDKRGRGGLECKSTTKYYLDSFTEPVPLPYFLQSSHYINITDADFWDIGTLIDGRYFECFPIERDNEFIQKLENEVSDWYEKHVMADKEPPKMVTDLDKSQSITGISIEADENIYNNITRHTRIKNEIKIKKQEKEVAEKIIKEYMQDAERMTYEGKEILTYKSNDVNKFNTKRFKKDNEWLYMEYCNANTRRRFINKLKITD